MAREDRDHHGNLHASPHGKEAGGAEQSGGCIVLARPKGKGGFMKGQQHIVPFLCPR